MVAGSENAEEAIVVEASDPNRVVLNRGSSHGVERGQEFVIYALSENELEDPVSGETLGRLERVKALGTVVNVQDRMCTIELERGYPVKHRVGRSSTFQAFPGIKIGDPPPDSLVRPEIGDRAKPMT